MQKRTATGYFKYIIQATITHKVNLFKISAKKNDTTDGELVKNK